VLGGVKPQSYGLGKEVVEEIARRGGAYSEGTAKAILGIHPMAGIGRIAKGLTGTANLTKEQMDDVIEQLVKYRVIGMGQVAQEAPDIAMRPLTKMFEMGQVREDLSRVTHFVDKYIREGWNPAEAANDVIRYHYSYAKDAMGMGLESQFLNRTFFFYRWFRRNLPGSTRNLFTHWGKHTAVAKSIRAIEQGLPTWQEEYQPKWMKERGPVQIPSWLPLVGGQKAEPRYFLSQAWWPFAELMDVTKPIQGIAERLAPPVKIPMELITGQEIYYKKPWQLYKGQRKDVLPGVSDVQVPAWVHYLMRQTRLVTEAQRMGRRVAGAEGPYEKLKEIVTAGALGARAYSFAPEREASQRFFETIKSVGIIKSEMKRAEREGDKRAYDYLTKLLEELGEKQEMYQEGML